MACLAHLSIQRVGYRKVPHVLDNTQRLQAWRQHAPVQFANTHFSPPSPGHNPNPKSAGRRLFAFEDAK